VAKDRYDPVEYWEGLLSTDFTIAGVAHPYLPRSFNGAMYRAMERSVRQALSRRGLEPPLASVRVLDVGSGVGLWLAFWQRLGVSRLNGLDLTETATRRLSEGFPDVEVTQADIGSGEAPELGRFDVISVVNVLLHLTDDAAFATALRNLGALLAPGGMLIVIDPVVVARSWRPPAPEANSKARKLSEWRTALADAHLRLERVSPVTVILDSPADARFRRSFDLRQSLWQLICRVVYRRETLGAIVGATLYRIDTVLVRLSRTGPSSKCLVITTE
jgi:2-polyprenyl-3-methyl-5-hydroxy-6-metoxy-1,4-benzoquinol methylase